MDKEFDYYVDVLSMTIMSLKGTYRTMVGAANVVFTVASIGLLIRFWLELGIIVKCILMLCAIFFPIIQPIIIYNKINKQLANLPKDIKVLFGIKGFTISNNSEKQTFYWNNIRKLSKGKNSFIVYVTDKNGYVFTRKMLGNDFDIIRDSIIKT